jgi:hypothetical protein
MDQQIHQVAIRIDGDNTEILKTANVGEELRPPLKNEPYVAAGMRTSVVQDAATCGSGFLVQTMNSLYLFLNVPEDALKELMPAEPPPAEPVPAPQDNIFEPEPLDLEDYEQEWA